MRSVLSWGYVDTKSHGTDHVLILSLPYLPSELQDRHKFICMKVTTERILALAAPIQRRIDQVRRGRHDAVPILFLDLQGLWDIDFLVIPTLGIDVQGGPRVRNWGSLTQAVLNDMLIFSTVVEAYETCRDGPDVLSEWIVATIASLLTTIGYSTHCGLCRR